MCSERNKIIFYLLDKDSKYIFCLDINCLVFYLLYHLSCIQKETFLDIEKNPYDMQKLFCLYFVFRKKQVYFFFSVK